MLVDLLALMETRDYRVEGMLGIARQFGVELTAIDETVYQILDDLDLV